MRRYLPTIATFALGLAVGWLISHRPAPAEQIAEGSLPEEISIAQPGEDSARRYRVVMTSTHESVRTADTRRWLLVVLWQSRNERTGSQPHVAYWCEPR